MSLLELPKCEISSNNTGKIFRRETSYYIFITHTFQHTCWHSTNFKNSPSLCKMAEYPQPDDVHHSYTNVFFFFWFIFIVCADGGQRNASAANPYACTTAMHGVWRGVLVCDGCWADSTDYDWLTDWKWRTIMVTAVNVCATAQSLAMCWCECHTVFMS